MKKVQLLVVQAIEKKIAISSFEGTNPNNDIVEKPYRRDIRLLSIVSEVKMSPFSPHG